MMKKICLVLMFCSFNTFAFDVKGLIDTVKEKALSVMDSKPKKETASKERELPAIPKVDKSGYSTKVYDKNGRIFHQGSKFNQLSLEQKNKYRLSFLEELYLSVRQSRATDEEIKTYMNVLSQGGSREGVYRSIVLHSDYKALEAFSSASSKELIRFVDEFTQKYLGIRFKKSDISSLNLWALKRIVVGKTLDVFDSFPSDGEDLYKWYAIMSTDLAMKFRYSNKVRRSSNFDYHMKWVRAVPAQHIKSELIIKLHQAMNQLQKTK